MVSLRAASCLLQPMVLVFQLLPSGAVELEGAAETESPVRIKELMQFMEAEPLALGVEEVSGNLTCLCSSPFPRWPSVLLPEWPHTPHMAQHC